MRKFWRDWREHALIGMLFAACLVLAVLQYRWTGELSRAEAQRLQAGARGGLVQFAQSFDSELRRAVWDLLPTGEDVIRLGPDKAAGERSRAARETIERPLFRRVAIAAPGPDRRLRLFEADRTGERFLPAAWPDSPDWRGLRDRLQAVALGQPPDDSIIDPATPLIEVPVFGPEKEAAWLVLELDIAYAADEWLPELARTYLDPEGNAGLDIRVAWRADRSRTVVSPAAAPGPDPPAAEATLFPVRYLGRRGEREPGRWVVSVAHRAGSIEAAVARSRWRNLGAALVLIALIGAAGIALVRNTRRARRLADAQFQFFAGVSHELRTPLTVIQGAGHNLLGGVVADAGRRDEYARAIVKQSAQLKEMVDQLLSYGSARQGSPADGSAPLGTVISEAIEWAAAELEQSGRSVDVDMPADPPVVRGDPAALRRVFANLILNAVRHGAGPVVVTASVAGPMAEIRVADSGEGIPPEDLKRVFEPFYRGERARSGRSRGTGLGLSLVKEIVEGLGGTVTAESGQGSGTVFSVRLPVAR